MQNLTVVVQVIIALGLLNVWLVRAQKSTNWRGGDAKNMKEEFAAYGLPAWSMRSVGALKIGLALLLVVSIWVPALSVPVATGIAVLMTGAVAMHAKIGDPWKKSVPALTLLVMALLVALQ